MKKLNIAVIGLGRIARLIHLPLISGLTNFSITAVSDIDKNKLKSVSEKFKIKNAFTDYTECFQNDEIDLVIISTPTIFHKEIALYCINCGKNVLIEKPIARNHKETLEIVEAAKKRRVSVHVGMNMRFRPDIMLLKSILSSNEIANPFFLKCRWFRKQSSDAAWFVRKEDAGGGVMLDLGIVLLDIALWLLDFEEVVSISAQNYSINTKSVEDTSICLLRNKNDATISIETSWSIEEENDSFCLEVFGSKGSVSLTPQQLNKVINNRKIELTSSGSVKTEELYKKSYSNQLKHIAGLIDRGVVTCNGAEESLYTMKIVEKIYKSAVQKEEVKL